VIRHSNTKAERKLNVVADAGTNIYHEIVAKDPFMGGRITSSDRRASTTTAATPGVASSTSTKTASTPGTLAFARVHLFRWSLGVMAVGVGKNEEGSEEERRCVDGSCPHQGLNSQR